MQPIITLDHVTAGYDGRPQVVDATFAVSEGDFVGVVGPNGGGKTTLMRVVLGLLKPMAGAIHYYNRGDGRQAKRLRMGYLPQYAAIDRDFPISVSDTILMGFNGDKPLWRGYTKEQRQAAARLMERTGLAPLASRPIKALSGGELQRVLLARAVVASPDVLVLDEPNTYIDEPSQQLMHELLSDVNARGCAVLMVSHDAEQVHAMARTIMVVNERVTVRSHTPHHVCQCMAQG